MKMNQNLKKIQTKKILNQGQNYNKMKKAMTNIAKNKLKLYRYIAQC